MKNNNKENGNILVSSLFIVIAMNLLAVTLVQTSVREFKIADLKTTDSSNLYLAESCTNDTVQYIKTLDDNSELTIPNGAPNNLPTNTVYYKSQSNLTNLISNQDSQQTANQLSKYSYNCYTQLITVKTMDGSTTNEGENVSEINSYGLSGSTVQRYYYSITSTGSGPSASNKRLITDVTVQY